MRRLFAILSLLSCVGCSLAESEGSAECLQEGDDVRLVQRHRTERLLESTPSFTIKDDKFMKDGEPFIIRSGSLHAPRIPQAYWRDRMQRAKALGLNTITTYVFWNDIEEKEGEFDLAGPKNFTAFLQVAKEEGLLVILRPGPYICGEWDLGGLPTWLLAKPGIKLRTYEPQYIAAVDRFWNKVIPMVKPFLYSNGGPVIVVQIENEYGSFGNCEKNPDDAKYMHHLLEIAVSHLGWDVLYSTVDGGEGAQPAKLAEGSPWLGNASVLATVDGGLTNDYSKGFASQKEFNAPGHSPKMWSELWTGWFTYWGEDAANKSAEEFTTGVGAMVKSGGSFNLYMAHGGTNFGTTSGANQIDFAGLAIGFQPDITSYDYSSPISEQGRHNIGADGGDLFQAVRNVISERYGTPPDEPEFIPEVAYGGIALTEVASFFDNLELLKSCSVDVADGKDLPSMESLNQSSGLILYRHQRVWLADLPTFWYPLSAKLFDRVQVFMDEEEVGNAYRPDLFHLDKFITIPPGKHLDLLVENMGHVNYGWGMLDDSKGLRGQPPYPGDWQAVCIPLDIEQLRKLPFTSSSEASHAAKPAVRRGTLNIKGEPQDTWLDTRGLTKGYIWVNGHNLGRYWEEKGPQHTLYLPAPFLRSGENEVIILELHDQGGLSQITSVDAPRYMKGRS